MEQKHAMLSDLLIEKWIRQRNTDNIIWKTKDGDKLSIRRMSDEHLNNAIECMQKVLDVDLDNLDFELGLV